MYKFEITYTLKSNKFITYTFKTEAPSEDSAIKKGFDDITSKGWDVLCYEFDSIKEIKG